MYTLIYPKQNIATAMIGARFIGRQPKRGIGQHWLFTLHLNFYFLVWAGKREARREFQRQAAQRMKLLK